MTSVSSTAGSTSDLSYASVPYAGPEKYSPRSDDLDDIQQPTDTPSFPEPEPHMPPSPQPNRLSAVSIISQDATRRPRPRPHPRHSTGTPTVEDLFKLFANTKSESREMRRALRYAENKLEQSRARAAKAERLALDMAQRVRDASDERAAVLREGAVVREELGQYKARYESALKEIARSQELLKDSDNLRYDAEAQAARARDLARRMRIDLLVSRAKEEGRRLGYEEGVNAGQNAGYYVGQRNDRDREGVADAMADILEDEDAFQGYDDRYSPQPRRQMDIPRTPEPVVDPPAQRDPVFDVTPPQQFPVSQPSTIGRYTNDDPFVTPTPAPRAPSTSASTTTLPPAPPSNLAFQPMSTISEGSSIPEVVNTEHAVSRHSSVRRSRVASPPATTPRSHVAALPSNPNMHVPVYIPVPPPGSVYEDDTGVPPIGGEDDLPPPPMGQTAGYPGGDPGYYPPASGSSQPYSQPPSNDDRFYGHEYAESVMGGRPRTMEESQHIAGVLRESSPRPPSQQFSPPRTGPPRRRPITTVPAPLAGPPQNVPSDERRHHRTQSLSSSGAQRYPGSPRQEANHLQAAPSPSKMRRSTSTGSPHIFVQSPSEPDVSIHTPSHEGAGYNDYLSPTSMPVQLPPSQPSSRKNSRTAPQPYVPQQHQSHPPPTIYTEPPSPSEGTRYAPRFPPTIHRDQSPQDPNPPTQFPPRLYAYGRPASAGENGVSSPASENNIPLPVQEEGPLPTRQRSQRSSRQPSSQSSPNPLPPTEPVPAVDRFYGGQQPIPVPPRTASRSSNAGYSVVPMAPSNSSHGHGSSVRGSPRASSPAPLPVPSPSRNGYRLPSVNSNAGATPRATLSGLPHANVAASPSWNTSGLPPGSPRAGSPGLPPGSLYTHFNKGSIASFEDVAELATGTASKERLSGGGGRVRT